MRINWSDDSLVFKSLNNSNLTYKIITKDLTNTSFINIFTNFFYSFIFCVKTVKMKLKGKTLRFKRLGSYFFYFKFGITHPSCSILHAGSYFKRKGKQKFVLFGYNKYTLLLTAKFFIYWKPSNLYHWRGIRLVRTFMRRKAGKVSEYR